MLVWPPLDTERKPNATIINTAQHCCIGVLSWIEFREFSLLIPVMFTGSVAFTYLSLPFVKEAAVKIKEVASMNNLTEIGHDLGIPGMESNIVMKTGPVNESNKGYIRKLDDDLRNFMADIGEDQAVEIVELQEMSSSGDRRNTDETSRLLDK